MPDDMTRRVADYLLSKEPIQTVMGVSRRLVLPGFDGLSLYDVARFFILGIRNGAITTRAGSIAYRFFLAVFPMLLFFIAVIPYIPIDNFQATLLTLLSQYLPEDVYLFVRDTMADLITQQRGGILSASFFAALFFAVRGMLGVMNAFNATYHSIDMRPKSKQILVSLALILLLATLLIAAILVQIVGGWFLDWLIVRGILERATFYYLARYGRFALAAALVFLGVSSIYYFAPGQRSRFRFVSPGSALATVVALVLNAGFNYYFNNFSNFNAVYGSVGAVLVLLIWINVNSLNLLVGFELNASIADAKATAVSLDEDDLELD